MTVVEITVTVVESAIQHSRKAVCTTVVINQVYASVILYYCSRKHHEKHNFLLHQNIHFHVLYYVQSSFLLRTSWISTTVVENHFQTVVETSQKHHFLLHRNVFCTTYKLNFYYCSRKVHGEFMAGFGIGAGIRVPGFCRTSTSSFPYCSRKHHKKYHFLLHRNVFCTTD